MSLKQVTISFQWKLEAQAAGLRWRSQGVMKIPRVGSTSQCPMRPFDHSSVKWGQEIPNLHFNGETEDWLMDLEVFPTFSTHGPMWFIRGGLLHLLHDAARGHCMSLWRFCWRKKCGGYPSSPTAVHPGRPWLLSTNYLEKVETWICRFQLNTWKIVSSSPYMSILLIVSTWFNQYELYNMMWVLKERHA